MHNISIRSGKRSDKLFKRSVNDSLSLNSYRVWVSCKQLEADSSSLVTPTFIGSTVNQNPACWVLGPSKTSLLTHVFIKPADWITGKVTYKIHYSSDGTGGTFNLNTYVAGITSDELIPDASGLIAFTVPEPDAAYKNTVFTPNADAHYFSISPEDFNVVLYIGRDGSIGGDSANNLLIYGVELIYRQGRVEFGKPYRPHRL